MKQFVRRFGIAFLLIVFGLVMGGGGAATLMDESRFAATAQQATGTVVGHEIMRSNDNKGPLYRAVIDFSTPDGQTHRIVDGIGKRPPDELGGTVTVLYQADRPEGGRVGGSVSVLGWVFAGVGGAALLAGIVLLVIGLRRSTRAA